jgi:hypothetical protein
VALVQQVKVVLAVQHQVTQMRTALALAEVPLL